MVVAAATAVIAAALFFALKGPAMGLVREWRAERHLAKARQFESEGEWNKALRYAKAAAQLSPSLDSLRLQFRVAEKGGHAHYLLLARVIAAHPEASIQDVADSFAAVAAMGDLVACQQMMDAFTPEQKADPVLRATFVSYLAFSNRHSDAFQVADSLPNGPIRNQANLDLCENLFRHNDAEFREELIRRLASLLRSGEKESVAGALRLVATMPVKEIESGIGRVALEEARKVDEWSDETELDISYLRWVLEPDERKALHENATRTYRESAPVALATWLLKTGDPQTVIFMSEKSARERTISPEMFKRRANAFAAQGRLRELAKELEKPPAGMPILDALAYKAAAARLAGNEAEETSIWSAAFEHADAQTERNEFYRLAEIAERFGAENWRMRALAHAIEHPLGVPPRTKELASLFQWLSVNDSQLLLAVSLRLLHREPKNVVLLNNVYYLSCVYGRPKESAVDRLEDLIAEHPAIAGFRGSLALTHYMLGNIPEARQTLESLGVPLERMDHPKRALSAAILYNELRMEEAKATAESVDWSRMSQGEIEFFRTLIKNASLAAIKKLEGEEEDSSPGGPFRRKKT